MHCGNAALLHVLRILFYLFLGIVYIQAACPDYSGVTETTVDSYDALKCAIASQVSRIGINTTIDFYDVIDINGNDPLAIYATSSSQILQAKQRTQIFNITANAHVSITNIAFLGTAKLSLPIAKEGGILSIDTSTVSLINTTVSFGSAVCTGGVYAASSEVTIEESRFFNNSISGDTPCAGALMLLGGTLNIRDSFFESNAGNTGGAVFATSAVVNISNSDFTQNFAAQFGGAIALLKSTGYVSDTITYRNAASDSGGAYSLVQCSDIEFHNIRCSQDLVTENGGCMTLVATTASVFNSSANGTAANNGGVFYVNKQSTLLLKYSTFSDSYAALAGGVVDVSRESSLELQQCDFLSNAAGGNGGVLSISARSSAVISDCFFDGNIITDIPYPLSAGGAVYCFLSQLQILSMQLQNSFAASGSMLYAYHCEVNISQSTFSHCEAESAGIYIGQQSSLRFSNSSLTNNSATLDTSGIKCEEATSCEVTHSQFALNHALDQGILSFFLTPSIEVHYCDFLDNDVHGSAGAVFIYSIEEAHISNCNFLGNIAHIYGGALLVEINSNVLLTDSVFRDNHAVAGGALYVFDSSNVQLQDVELHSNYALDSGGAVYVGDHSTFNATDVAITASVAPAGGGIYAAYYAYLYFTRVNCSNNISPYAGGGLYIFDQSLLVSSRSYFDHNIASIGGAISAAYQSYLYISKSTFINNRAVEIAGAFYVAVKSAARVTHCIVTGNAAAVQGGVSVSQSSDLLITSSLHMSNKSPTGGCYAIFKGRFRSSESQFISNGGSDVISGGVLYSSSGGTIKSENSSYANNTGNYGGVFALDGSDFSSIGDRFSGCVAAVLGGCLFAQLDSSVHITGTVFRNNKDSSNAGSVMQITDGSLSMESVVAEDNEAAGSGPFAILKSNVTVTNSRFSRNKVSSKNSRGGAMFLGCGDCSSAQEDYGSITVSITDSSYADNDASLGFGGGLFFDSFPGSVSIERCTFSGNFANDGGAIASTGTAVDIANSSFYNNSVYQGGGALYWIYSDTRQAQFVGENIFDSNTAAYGDDQATNMVQLSTAGVDDDTEEVSGQALANPIYVNVLDYYGQTVTNSTVSGSKAVTVYCSVYNDSGTIRGSTIVSTTTGVADFSDLVLTSNPGSFILLDFSVPSSEVQDYQLKVDFRDCQRGEITFNAGDGLSGCQKCSKGTYSFHPHDNSCEQCPDNCKCPGGDVLDLESGYWRVDRHSATILQCSVPDVCDGGDDVDSQCADGQTGPYCDVCEDGYVKNQQGVCFSCDNSTSLLMEIISTVLFIVAILLLLMVFKYRKKIIKWYSKKADEISKNRKFQTLRVKAKILVAFSQIVFQIGPALDIVFPISFRNYLNYYSIFQLDALNLPDVQCGFKANFYTSLLVSTISPFVLFAVAAVTIQLMVLRAYRLNSRNPHYKADTAWRDTITVSFLISYFVLVSVSTKIFQVFQCEKFDDGNSYLVADYSISCDSSERAFYVAYGAVMILIYPVGIPLIYAVILFRNRHLINPNWRLVVDGKEKIIVSNKVIQAEKIKVRNTYPEIYNIRNLYDSYVPKRWYFELFDCARRLLLGAVPVLIIRGSIMQIIIVLIVSLASVATFMHFSPYIHEHDNKLAIIAQWSITAVLISALIIRVEAISDDNENETVIGATLIILNLVVVSFAIASALLHTKAAKLEAADVYDPHEEDPHMRDDDASIADDDEWQDRIRLTQQLQHQCAEQQGQGRQWQFEDEMNGDIPLSPLHRSGAVGGVVAPAAKREGADTAAVDADADSDDEFASEDGDDDAAATYNHAHLREKQLEHQLAERYKEEEKKGDP